MTEEQTTVLKHLQSGRKSESQLRVLIGFWDKPRKKFTQLMESLADLVQKEVIDRWNYYTLKTEGACMIHDRSVGSKVEVDNLKLGEQFLMVQLDHRAIMVSEITSDMIELIHHGEVSVFRFVEGNPTKVQIFDSDELDGDLSWMDVQSESKEASC